MPKKNAAEKPADGNLERIVLKSATKTGIILQIMEKYALTDGGVQMALVSFFLMWSAVLALSVFFACRGADSTAQLHSDGGSAAAVPLCTVCGVILVLFAAGCADVLRVGAWCVLAAGFAAAG
jgi:hypothetical protein